MKLVLWALALSLPCSLPHSVDAALVAHLYIDRIESIGRLFTTDANDNINERTGAAFGEEPYWHVAILDVDMDTLPADADLTPWTSYFADASCNQWFVRSTLSIQQDFARTIPGQQMAWFYVGVFDYDLWPTNNNQFGTRLAELLGDHHVSGIQSYLNTPQANNNQSRWYLVGTSGSSCGLSPTGTGAPAGNWDIYYRTFYEDTTAPSSATIPYHDDADAPAGFNNDGTLTLRWTSGSDADSGIRQSIRLERSADGQSCDIALGNSQTSFDFTGTVACDTSGSLETLTLEEGQSYRARITTRNGAYPTLDVDASVDSGFSPAITQQSVTGVGDPSRSAALSLRPARPNPFNPATSLHYSLDVAGLVRLRIYDASGRCVAELVREQQAAGEHRVVWDGRGADGAVLSSGVYFARIESQGRIQTQKLTLLQ